MLIGTYYYYWYRENWLRFTPYVNDPPVLGQYDNTKYGKIINEHFWSIKKSGIDFVIVSWDPLSDYGYVIDAALEADIKICIMYESLFRLGGKHITIKKEHLKPILDDLSYLACDLDEECWFTINNKPVVMLYVSRNYEDENCFEEIRKVMEKDIFLAGDEAFWEEPSIKRLSKLDAAFTYNWFQVGRFNGDGIIRCNSFLDNVDTQVKKWDLACKSCGMQYWPVAMPGYDDTYVRPVLEHPVLPRMNGHMLLRSLTDSLDINPYVITICSFNEHYEGTGIEPIRSYGNKYLDMVKFFKHQL